MSNNRIFNLLIGFGIAVVLVAGWFIGVSPILEQVRAAETQTQTIQAANTVSSTRLATVKKQFENIGPLQTKLQALQGSIPAEADVPGFLAEINSVGAATGISLTSLAVNHALAYVAPGAAVVPAAGAAATPAPTDTAAPIAPAAKPPADPATGLIAIPVKVTVSGSYAQVMAFAGALQSGARLLFVTNLAVTASTSDASFSADLTGNIYALPLPAGVTLPKSGAAPAPAVTPTPAPTPTETATETPSPDPTETPAG